MTSSRLPGKVLADLCGESALQHMLSRVQRSQRIDGIVVATTTNDTDDPVVALCEKLGVAAFRGDEADVLGRFHDAAQLHDADPVVRLTADCPMIDPKILDEIIARFEEGEWDYVSNCNLRTYPD